MFGIGLTVQGRCIVVATTLIASMVGALAAKAAAPSDRVPSLVGETYAQFQIAYRLHPEEGKRRLEQLTAVVNAWRAAPRTDANNERLATWLRAAIRASMPGSREGLPASPSFTAASTIETHPVVKPKAPEPTPVEPAVLKAKPAAGPTPAPNKQALEADPFRDDPADE